MSNHKKKFFEKHRCPRCDGTGYLQGEVNTNITEKQKKLFTAFKKYYTEHGHAPSVRMLAAIEMEAPTAVYNKLTALVDKGNLGRIANGKKHIWNNWYIKKDIERR